MSKYRKQSSGVGVEERGQERMRRGKIWEHKRKRKLHPCSENVLQVKKEER
jgi:hypothetical protein